MPTTHRRRGFTLIELLVVVAIIALLIAILLPSLARARESAKLTVCQTRLRSWAQGFNLYAHLNNDTLPFDGDDGTASKPIGRWDDPGLWFNGVAELLHNKSYNDLQLSQPGGPTPPPHAGLPAVGANSLFLCPSATEVQDGADPAAVANGYFQTYGWTPTFAVTARDMLLCYSYNSQLRNIKYSKSNYPGAPDPAKPADVSKLARLNNATILVVEKRVSPTELDLRNPLQASVKTQSLLQNKVAPKRFAARHRSGGSLAFADGHVEWASFETVNAANSSTPQYNQPGLIWSVNP